MAPGDKKSIISSSLSPDQAAQIEQIQKLINKSDDLSTSFTLLTSKVKSARGAINDMASAVLGGFNAETLETFSNELDKLTAARSKLLGITKTEADSIKESLGESYGELAQYGVKFSEIADTQNLFIKEYSTNSKFSNEQTKTLLLTSKATGIETEKLVHNFRQAGMGIEQMNKTMQTTMDYARSIGVASSAVLSKVTENIGKLNLYNFSEGEKGLAKMAAQSSMLGIDMSKVFAKSEELLDPQKAIDLSASLQRLGVTSSQLLDPLRAMDLAQNDPAELQNQMVELSKQFVRTKEDGSFEILPGAKRQLREVALQLGLNADELASMGLKSAEAAKKLQEMRFPDGLKVSDEQKQLIANMASMGKGGQYEVAIKREERDEMGNVLRTFTEKKAVTELNDDDLKLLAEQSQPIKLEDLSQKQLDQMTSINNKIEAYMNRRLVGMGTSGVVSQTYTGAEKFADRMFEKLYEANGSNQQVVIQTINELKQVMKSNAAAKIESGKFTAEDFESYLKEVGGKVAEMYGRNITDIAKVFVKEFGGGTELGKKIEGKLDDPKIQELLGGAAIALGTLTPEIKDLVSVLKNIFKVKDAIVQGESSIISLGSGEVVMTDEKDKIAVGTNLDGKNNTTNLQETLTRKPTPTQGVTVGESRVSIDLVPLTTLMSEYVKNNKPQTINLSGLEQLKPTQTPVSEQMMAELKKIVSDSSQNKQMSSLESIKDMSSVKGGRNNDNLTALTNQETGRNLSLNTPKTVRETTVPTFNPPQIARLERPISAPTQKVEFGNLEISLKVDIPNSANVSTEQVKEVLQTTMNSADFKQKIVVAVNEAKTNYGLTSVGGTSNYGSTKTNYDSIA